MLTLPVAKDEAIAPVVSFRPTRPPTLLCAPPVTAPLALAEPIVPVFTPTRPPTLFSAELVLAAPTVTFAADDATEMPPVLRPTSPPAAIPSSAPAPTRPPVTVELAI